MLKKLELFLKTQVYSIKLGKKTINTYQHRN